MDGIFAVWKPKGPTSHDIIDEVRRKTGERRVGHAGTLDPLAEGVLIIATGKSTKLLGRLVSKEKEYIATVKLGEWSATDDAEGDKTPVRRPLKPSRAAIAAALAGFVGEIDQVPPAYSAVKVAGERAYRLARQGKAVELKPRRVTIKNINIMSYRWPYLKLKVTTGPGAYIRALARDVGLALGTGGYLASLQRVRVGEFRKRDCLRMNDIFKKSEAK